MNYTTNYNLKKPTKDDFYNVDDQNSNSDFIDSKLKEIDNKASNITVPVTKVNNKTGDVVLTASDLGAALPSQIPTKTSQLANDSGYETTSGSQSKASAAQTAAQSYADSKITQLINSAPGALDTLKELADAMGDDPNFAATITNLITSKFNDIGGAGRTTESVKGNTDAIANLQKEVTSHTTESAYFKKGNATFLNNTTTLRIDDNWITANTQLFINLTTNPSGIWTWKTYSGYFTITSDSTERIDVVFNWSAVKGGGD